MANDFKTRKTLGGGKVITRKGSKYEADIQNEANVLRKVAARSDSLSKDKKEFWANKEKAESVGAKIVADRVKDTKLENDFSKK